MSKTIKTVTIGIPAHNEGHNIGHLLVSLLNQKTDHIKLTTIIVISDGSTDDTVAKAKAINDPRIQIIINKKRKGIVYSQNKILKAVTSDILVFLDGDVIPTTHNFLEEITKPIREDKRVGLVGAATIPLRPVNVFERIITNSHYLKQYLYKQIKSGNNVYLCHGRARAFSKQCYTSFVWKNDCPEDAFSYFSCIENKFLFRYTQEAAVFFRSPQTLTDHTHQSTRFVAGKQHLQKIFGSNMVSSQYSIPRRYFLKTIMKYLLRNPFSTPMYILITIYIRLFASKNKRYSSRFITAASSKKIFLHKGHQLSRV